MPPPSTRARGAPRRSGPQIWTWRRRRPASHPAPRRQALPARRRRRRAEAVARPRRRRRGGVRASVACEPSWVGLGALLVGFFRMCIMGSWAVSFLGPTFWRFCWALGLMNSAPPFIGLGFYLPV
uniref:Uncharacterized protein n=1 Tax=Oryza glaberrima TaxID=4538 RepID=I1NKJ5_ORYGL